MTRTRVSQQVISALGVAATGWLFAAPAPAKACSSSPLIVDEVRVTQVAESCLSVDGTHDLGDYEHPTLRIQNDCPTPIEVRIPDCVPCYKTHVSDRCFDCNEEWVLLRGEDVDGVPGEGVRELIFQLDFPIDDLAGETVQSSIDWSRSDDESGELALELDMADKHPTQQATEACPGLCSVAATASPPALGAVLMLLGLWGRRRKSGASAV